MGQLFYIAREILGRSYCVYIPYDVCATNIITVKMLPVLLFDYIVAHHSGLSYLSAGAE